MNKRKFLQSAVASLCTLAALTFVSPTVAASENWPEKPIHLLVGFAPGGPTDVVARILGEEIGRVLNVPVVIDNKPGAAGNIAAVNLTNAPSDGYTFLYNTSSIVIAPWVYDSVGYNPLEDFEPVALTAAVPLVLITNPTVPAETADQLINLVKENPGQLNYASSGTGAIEHLTAAQILSLNNAEAEHIPYKGTAPAQVDLISGATQFTTTTLNTAIPPIKNNQLRPLAITSLERSHTLPDVPTVDESLIPGFESLAWQGIVAPAGTSEDILTKLNAAINEALKSDTVIKQLDAQGTMILGGSVEEYKDYIDSEYSRWGEVVKEAGVEPR